MEIYITCLLQILSFFSRFRRFEMKNFLCQPTMMADNISQLGAPKNFFYFYGPTYYVKDCAKIVQIQSFFWSESGKCKTKKTPYLDTFHTVKYSS